MKKEIKSVFLETIRWITWKKLMWILILNQYRIYFERIIFKVGWRKIIKNRGDAQGIISNK